MPNGAVIALLLVLCSTVVGCNTAGVRAGGSALGKAGGAWANETADAVLGTRADLETYVEAQYISAALQGTDAPTADRLDNIAKAADVLAARAQMLRSLADAYSAMGNLAAYDAAGQVETAIGNFVGSVNDYAKAVGSDSPPISNVVGAITGIVGSNIAGEIQAEQIKKASQLVRAQLTRVQALLKKEQGTMGSLREEIIRGEKMAALALWGKGIGVPSPILEAQLTGSGLQYDEKQAMAAIDGDRAKFGDAITRVVGRRAERRMGAQAGILATTYAAMGDLMTQHANLEAEQQLDLDAIATRLAELRKYAAELSTAAEQDRKDRSAGN